MKPRKCPTCGRSYVDDTLNFCLEDGAPLVFDSFEEPATAILPARASDDIATRIHTADKVPAGTAQFRSRMTGMPMILGAAAVLLVGGALAVYFFAFAKGKKIDSIAVMPFVNASGSPDLEYLSDGITESLIISLTRVPDLSVKARSSVFSYKGKEVSPQQVAKDLSVEGVLNGRLVQRGDEVSLNLELVEAATGDRLWGETYNRTLADLTSLQSEIARDVSGKLQQKLSGADQQLVAKNYTQNTEAYQLYLRGKYHWNKRNRADIVKSIEFFRQAIDKDPLYALAYSGLAEAYVLLPAYTGEPPQVAYPRARVAAARALEIDEGLAEAHAALAGISSEYDWNFPEAERGFRRAIELNPNYATAHHWYAEFLMVMGRAPEALIEMKRAQELDPLSIIINGLLGVVLRLNGRHDEAIAQLHRTIDLDPKFPRSHVFLGEVYQELGRYEEAAAEFVQVAYLSGMPRDQADKALADALAGYKKDGPPGYYRVLAEQFEERSKMNEVSTRPPVTALAAYWLHAGEKEKAYTLLEEGLRHRDPTMLRIRDTSFNHIKSEPRYQQITRQIGLPPV